MKKMSVALGCLLLTGCAMRAPTPEEQQQWTQLLKTQSAPGRALLAKGQLETRQGDERRVATLTVWGEGEKRTRIVLRDMKERLVAALMEEQGKPVNITKADGTTEQRSPEAVHGQLSPVTSLDLFRLMQGDYIGPFVPYEDAEMGPKGGFHVEARNGAKGELFLKDGRPERLEFPGREITFQYGDEDRLSGARILRDGKLETAVSFHSIEYILRELESADYVVLTPPDTMPKKKEKALKKKEKKRTLRR